MSIIFQDKRFIEHFYNLESDFENNVFEKAKLLFGKDAILINSKKKISTQSFGGAIPDGILFNFKDLSNPEFYLVEVELKNHSFFEHIFPQITKFFAFFRNQNSQRELIDKIYQIVNSDNDLKREFKRYLGENEIYKSIGDIIENSQNILLIIDGIKDELPEVVRTYTDTWGKIVKIPIIRRYDNGNDYILHMEPDFEYIDDIQDYNANNNINIPDIFNEDYHLDGISEETVNIYNNLKAQILQMNGNLVFNPQKYYISVRDQKNLLYIQTRKKKLRIIALFSYEHVQEVVHNYSITQLSQGVQNFYNGPSSAIEVNNANNLEEIVNLIREKMEMQDL